MSSPLQSSDAASSGAGAAAPDELGPAPADGPSVGSGAGLLAGWTLSPSRMRLLALVSALSTGVVIWAGLAQEGSSGLAAALAHRRSLLASAGASPASSSQPADVQAESPASDEAGEAGSSPTASENGSEAPAAANTRNAGQASEAPAAASSGAAPGATGRAPSSRSPTTAAKRAEAKIKHVFVITLASPGYEQTWGPASPAKYLTTQLRPQGALLTNYYGVGHLDLPNYIAMISGQPPNPLTQTDCPTFSQFPAGSKLDSGGRLEAPGCVYPVDVLTLADQLTSTRRQWRAYVEDLANGPKSVQSCRHPNTEQPDETQKARPGDAYATRHNPFVYFHSLLDLGDCASDDLALTQLAPDLRSTATTPNYAFIVPNLCHDGSEASCPDGSAGGLGAADDFLAEWVPKILASPAYRKNGLLVITFADGPSSDTSGCCTSATATGPASSVTGGGRVGALLLSPFVTPGSESATPYNHYSLLRTVEDIFALPHLANAAQPDVPSFASGVLRKAFPTRP
jgi:phosphatidylinositol-3-phosphatase